MDNSPDQKKVRIAATYNAASDHFDNSPLAFWDRFGRRSVERLSLSPGSSVLDVGCGTGASAIPAAQLVGPTGRVIGVDLAQNLLDLAKKKALDNGLKNVEFQLGDMEHLGYDDGRFDAVICVFAIFFVEDMQAQAGELWRMVKPGGKLAITTWGPRLFEPGESAWWEIIRRERPELYSLDNPWDRIIDPKSVENLLVDSGVPNPIVAVERGQQLLQTPEDWWTVVIGSGNRGIVDQLDVDSAARVRRANIQWACENSLTSIETNVIYAVARKEAL